MTVVHPGPANSRLHSVGRRPADQGLTAVDAPARLVSAAAHPVPVDQYLDVEIETWLRMHGASFRRGHGRLGGQAARGRGQAVERALTLGAGPGTPQWSARMVSRR